MGLTREVRYTPPIPHKNHGSNKRRDAGSRARVDLIKMTLQKLFLSTGMQRAKSASVISLSYFTEGNLVNQEVRFSKKKKGEVSFLANICISYGPRR